MLVLLIEHCHRSFQLENVEYNFRAMRCALWNLLVFFLSKRSWGLFFGVGSFKLSVGTKKWMHQLAFILANFFSTLCIALLKISQTLLLRRPHLFMVFGYLTYICELLENKLVDIWDILGQCIGPYCNEWDLFYYFPFTQPAYQKTLLM